MENTVETIFVENSVLPEYKAPVKWIENVEPLPLTEFEKNMNKIFITPDQLLQQEKEEQENPNIESEEEKEKRMKKEYITKVKVIALDKMDKHPLSNPTYFKTRDKNKLIELMKEVMKQTEEEITNEFNKICNEVLFAPESNYTNYSVYKN